MDDPWANAWGEDNSKKDDHWKPPSRVTAVVDTETDIAAPSWSTGADISWSEPSPDQGSFWGSTQTDTWEPPSFATIPSATAEPQPPISPVDAPPSPPATAFETEPPSPAPDSLEDDGFGTFESGTESGVDTDANDDDEDPWSPSRAAFVPVRVDSIDNAWGAPAWSPREEADDHNIHSPHSEAVDEWETARQEKQKQDLYVPPELLQSILGEFELIGKELWPEPENAPEPRVMTRIEDMDHMAHLAQRIIPSELTLQTAPTFHDTFIAKRTAEAVKLTRHVPFTRASPMSQYLASKGSVAWETSIKSRIDVSQDDLMPVGWRLAEKDKEIVTPADTKKKTGGLMSFFGRGPSTPPAESNGRSQSPVAIKTPTHTPRPSVDIIKPPDLPLPISKEAPLQSPTSFMTTTATSPLASPPLLAPEDSQAQPSAVSRFLNRFSRTRSATQNSPALSSDDLAFLSDIPGSQEIMEDDLMKGMSLLTEVPLAPKLALALPPPPTLPPQRLAAPRPPASKAFDDDFGSFFDAPIIESTTQAINTLAAVKPLVSASSSFLSPKSSISNSNGLTQQATKRAITAVMSSSQGTASIPNLGAALSFLPPPPSISAQPSTSSQSSNLFDDDFSSFSAPAASRTFPASSSFNTSISAFSSNQSLVPASRSGSSSVFDNDFDDFVTSPIHSPSPPKPPTKSPPTQAKTNLIASSPSQRPLGLQNPSHAIAPSFTGSPWPAAAAAPPTPNFPPSRGISSPAQLDIFGSTSGRVPPPASTGVPALPRPSQAFPSSKPPSSQPPAKNPTTAARAQGGLSAQDLSFFEGL